MNSIMMRYVIYKTTETIGELFCSNQFCFQQINSPLNLHSTTTTKNIVHLCIGYISGFAAAEIKVILSSFFHALKMYTQIGFFHDQYQNK